MKTIVIDRNKVIRDYVATEVKKNDLCFVIWNPGESLLWNQVNSLVDKNIQPEGDGDDKVVILPLKDMKEVKEKWEKVLSLNLQSEVEFYKNGKQTTF